MRIRGEPKNMKTNYTIDLIIEFIKVIVKKSATTDEATREISEAQRKAREKQKAPNKRG